VDIFEQYGGKPTFFWVGSRITSAPAEYAVGHGAEIASHSWRHEPLTDLSAAEQLDQINRTDERIAQFTDLKPLWFRAPYNNVNSGTLNQASLTQHLSAHHDVITLDYQHIPVSDLVKIFDKPKPGAIYLFHEGQANTVAALPTILANLKKKGYTVVTNTELLKYGPPSADLDH